MRGRWNASAGNVEVWIQVHKVAEASKCMEVSVWSLLNAITKAFSMLLLKPSQCHYFSLLNAITLAFSPVGGLRVSFAL
jgi:hypothetical protein